MESVSTISFSPELANAIIYSSRTGEEVRLPVDRAAYSALLDSLRSAAGARP